MGLNKVIYQRRHKTGSRPTIVNKAIIGTREEQVEMSSWLPPIQTPTYQQGRFMIAKVIGKAIETAMNNNFYQFNNVIMQAKGGAMQLNCTSKKSRSTMLVHDKLVLCN